MVRTEDLKDERDEIVRYLNERSLNVFYGEDVSEKGGAEIQWKRKDGWKDFVDLGKAEGITTVVVEELMLEKDELDRLSHELPDALMDEIHAGSIEKFRTVVGKVGALRLLWIKNGVKYSYYQSTDWFDEVGELLTIIDKMGRAIPAQAGDYSLPERALPESVRLEAPEKLADEMMAFMKKEYGVADSKIFLSASRVFWEKKGVSQFGDADAELLKGKIRGMVQTKIAEAEKEKIPGLVEATVKWGRENGFRKLTKQNLKAFLAEKNESLSKSSEDMLLTRVNIKLTR